MHGLRIRYTCSKSTPDGVCNLVRYGNYYGTHSVTIPCNYYVSFDMGEIGKLYAGSAMWG